MQWPDFGQLHALASAGKGWVEVRHLLTKTCLVILSFRVILDAPLPAIHPIIMESTYHQDPPKELERHRTSIGTWFDYFGQYCRFRRIDCNDQGWSRRGLHPALVHYSGLHGQGVPPG